MQISKLKKEINDELTTMETTCGNLDVEVLSVTDKGDRLDITYKTTDSLKNNAVMARYEQIKHSDEMLKKLDTATSIDKKEYGEILSAISARFNKYDMDNDDCLKECQLQLLASFAYIKYLEETLDNTQSIVIAYGEKITKQKDSLLNMCARLGKMGHLAYHNIQAKMTEVFGDEEGAQRAAIKKEQWKDVERKCKETVERNNRPIELTVGDKHVSPKDLGWH